jgi:hypothetical protein
MVQICADERQSKVSPSAPIGEICGQLLWFFLCRPRALCVKFPEVTRTAIPEPSTLALAILALLGLMRRSEQLRGTS